MSSSFPESPEIGNADVLSALRGGDYRAFEEIYRARFEDLFKYALSFVGDDDAADVVQDVFVAVWNNRSVLPVRTDTELLYYLLRAVRNRALKVVRHTKIQHAHRAEVLHESDASESVNGPAVLSDSHDDFILRVKGLIEALPSRSREVLLLRWYHGLPFEEIASIMGISYGYAHVLHSRALALVRKRLNIP